MFTLNVTGEVNVPEDLDPEQAAEYQAKAEQKISDELQKLVDKHEDDVTTATASFDHITAPDYLQGKRDKAAEQSRAAREQSDAADAEAAEKAAAESQPDE